MTKKLSGTKKKRGGGFENLSLLRYRNGNISNRSNLKSLNISKETATASKFIRRLQQTAFFLFFVLFLHSFFSS